MTHDGFKSLAERLGRDCSSPNPDDLVNAIDAMFTELRADLVRAPSRAQTSEVQDELNRLHGGFQFETSMSGVTKAMRNAANHTWLNWEARTPGESDFDGTAMIVRAYRAMRVLEPERPVEITEAMVKRAAREIEERTGFSLATGIMLCALHAALSTTPSEGEMR